MPGIGGRWRNALRFSALPRTCSEGSRKSGWARRSYAIALPRTRYPIPRYRSPVLHRGNGKWPLVTRLLGLGHLLLAGFCSTM